MRLASRLVRIALAVGTAMAVLALLVVLRLAAGPIGVEFLHASIARAIASLAPDLKTEIDATSLARSGWGAAFDVTGFRLRAPDGTVVLSLPALSLRPSFGALVRGRFVIARVDVADARLALTRRADGAWLMGTGEGGQGAAELPALHGQSASSASGAQGLPRFALTQAHVVVDDQRSGGKLELANADLVVSPRPDRVEVTGRAELHVVSAVPMARGALDLPVEIAVSAARTEAGALGTVDFTLAGGKGALAPPPEIGAPFALADLTAEGQYLPEVETLRLARFAGTLGKSKLAGKTTVILGATPLLALDATVDALGMEALARLWPPEAAPAVRTWLATNAKKGTLRRCRVQLGLHGAAPEGDAKPNAFDVACDFDGVTADYLAPMDPITKASGSAHLTAERLTVRVTAGSVGACTVEKGTLAMDLTVDPPRAEIAADVNGAGADVLALVDQPPLALVSPLGIKPKDLGGQSRVHAELRLPIRGNLGPSEVKVDATASLVDASLPPLAAGIGIRDGMLEVRVVGRKFEVKGKTVVTGVPFVTAPVTIALTVAPGAKGTSQNVQLALEGDGVVARGSASLAGNTVSTLTVDRLRFGRSDLNGRLSRRASGEYDVTVAGATLDLEALLANAPAGGEPNPIRDAGYTLHVDLGSVRATPELEVRNLRGTVAGRGDRVTTATLGGALMPSGTVQVTLDTAGRFTLRTDQAGRVLALFGMQQFVGGSLDLDASTDARGPQQFLDGKVKLRDVKVVRAPVLAKVLGVGSLGGIASLLQGEGMPLAKARIPFRWENQRLTVREMRAVGAVGLTADGVVDLGAGTCDVRGNVIPAYTLNSALGKVPVIGRFLVGGKGGGVFGIDYRVSGKLPDPNVRVNPLRSVAPTVLRAWFVDPFTHDASRGR